MITHKPFTQEELIIIKSVFLLLSIKMQPLDVDKLTLEQVSQFNKLTSKIVEVI